MNSDKLWNRNTLNIQEWAEYTVTEYVQTIKDYIKAGISKQRAIEMVLKQSSLGKSYKDKVISQFI